MEFQMYMLKTTLKVNDKSTRNTVYCIYAQEFFSSYAKVMLNAWSTTSCPKLCWHNLFKPIANSSPSKVYSYLDDQRKQSNITPGFKLIL